ncbi:MAG: flagellar biosynthetic protein FliO [Novosphingobium sp.]
MSWKSPAWPASAEVEFLAVRIWVPWSCWVLVAVVGGRATTFHAAKWLARLGDKLGAKLGERTSVRRLELVERLAIDPRRSVVMIRSDARDISLLIAPEGVIVLDSMPIAASPALIKEAAE